MSTATPSTPPSSCAAADFTVFPTNDTACAIVSTLALPSNTSAALDTCCKTADVEEWNGNCGFYCLSIQQTVAQLQACFQEKGVKPQNIMCNSNQTATATGTGSGQASRTSGAAGATSSTGAAGAIVPGEYGKAGAAVMGMLVVAVFAGGML